MKKIIVLTVVLVLIFLGLWGVLHVVSEDSDPGSFGEVPSRTPIDPGAGNGDTSLDVELRDGSTREIPNIQQTAESVGGGAYVLRGGPSDSERRYAITFHEAYDFFQVSLEDQPLSEVRHLAEQDLLAQLGVSEEEICQFDVSVRTRVEIDREYAGRELGLSMCDGAVNLSQ